MTEIELLELPEFQLYMQKLLEYKKEKSDYAKYRAQYAHFEFSEELFLRAEFYDRQRRHKKFCREYYAVKAKYLNALARLKYAGSSTLAELPALDTSRAFAIAETAMDTEEAPRSYQDILNTARSKKQKITNEGHQRNPDVRATLRRMHKEKGTLLPEWIHEYDEVDGVEAQAAKAAE